MLKLDGILKITPGGFKVPQNVVFAANELAAANHLVRLAPENLHITVLHQSLTEALKCKDFSSEKLPKLFVAAPRLKVVEAEGRKSLKIVLCEDHQSTLKTWLRDFAREYIPGLELPQREFHISWANLTGLPRDSVK
jgi:hypothetical protein